MSAKPGPSIKELSSAVHDNGRRGEPKAGCDCMQCFGYCIVDADQAVRDQALRHDARRGIAPTWGELDFEESA